MSGAREKLVLNADETLLQDAARGFLARHAPISRYREMRDAGKTHDADLWAEMAAQGWAGVLIDEAHGGAGMGHVAAGLLAGEMGRTLATTPFISTAVIAATTLGRAGAADPLKAIAGGGLTYALALDETAKFAPEATAMTARAEGNGFVLDGTKAFVIGGGSADRLLVLARTAEDRLSLFDLEADRAGITRNPLDLIDQRDTARIDFAGVKATGADMLGEEGGGLAVLAPATAAGQAALSAELTGVAAGAFAMTAGYLHDRRQFGVPIGAFQALQHRAAHLWSEIEITASAVLNAGRMLDADPDGAGLAVSVAKARANATARLAVSEGVQMHGGIGMTDAFDMGFFMKRARLSAEWLGDYGYHAGKVATARGF